MPQLSFHSPLGELTVSEEDGFVVSLDWGWGRDQEETALLCQVREQLNAYFDGQVVDFSTIRCRPYGTPYQQSIWKALRAIPYGETRRYGEIAALAGGSPRSVGGAVGANPIPLLIPCHRVVGVKDRGGYSGLGGRESKDMLLNLEAEFRPPSE